MLPGANAQRSFVDTCHRLDDNMICANIRFDKIIQLIKSDLLLQQATPLRDSLVIYVHNRQWHTEGLEYSTDSWGRRR